MTHQSDVLNHLKRNPAKGITNAQAFELYNDTRLGSTIYALRGKGHKIGDQRIQNKTNNAKHCRYFLVK